MDDHEEIQSVIDTLMVTYMAEVPALMAQAMVRLGNAFSHGKINEAQNILNDIEENLNHVVSMAARIAATVNTMAADEVDNFEVPDDLSGLEDL